MACNSAGVASASRVLLMQHHHHPGNKIEMRAGGSGRRNRVAMLSPGAFSADLKLELSHRSSPDQIARLLECTTWTGAGPGLMDAAIKGALEANKPVGGFKIAKESGEWSSSNFHPYLPSESYLTCRFFSARKHGLVDAAVRNEPSDMTVVVAFPGGIGTLDEVFEILALIQLNRIGSELPVPFLLMNYDFFYSKLLEFFHDCEKWGAIAEGEIASLWRVCNGNTEALEYLANFYSIPQSKRNFGNQEEHKI